MTHTPHFHPMIGGQPNHELYKRDTGNTLKKTAATKAAVKNKNWD